MENYLFIILSLLAFGTFSACNEVIEPIDFPAKAYFPNDEGKIRTYFVVDTNYNSVNSYDAKTYFSQERQMGPETDLMGREVRRLEIWKSQEGVNPSTNPILNYDFVELWTQYCDDRSAERVEGNTRYEVLQFPPLLGLSWDGNRYNSEETETYSIVSSDSTVLVQGNSYENCIVIQQKEKVNISGGGLTLRKYAYEIYSPGIGKVKGYFEYYWQDISSGVPDPESRTLIEELVSHN